MCAKAFGALLLCLLPLQASAYDDRVALVIGNDNYVFKPLATSVNDARAVKKTLTDLGFKVVYVENADIAAMRLAAVQFAKAMDGALVAVFYYSGHAVQYKAKNYLIPATITQLTTEAELVYTTLESGQISDSMEDAKVRHKFLILDASRGNPFVNLNLSTGLAPPTRIPPGTTLAYSTAVGAISRESNDATSPYTTHLVKEMRTPELVSNALFTKVASAVALESNNAQIPSFQSTPQPRGPFYFVERDALAPKLPEAAAATQQLDRDFWQKVKDTRSIDELKLFIQEYPASVFIPSVKVRIETLEKEYFEKSLATWKTIKDSKKIEDFQTYLSKFPKGDFAEAAEIRVAKLESEEKRNKSAGPPNEVRRALVIGNAAYKDDPLLNPVNDAGDFARTLESLGFQVTLKTNVSQKQMKQAIREFGQALKTGGGVGLFYFAGHGVQSRGRNYLIPVGASIESEAEIEDESVDANLVLSHMDEAKNRVNIVVMDACRNNPYARSFRSANRGLAPMDAATGSFIAFATAPGSVAADGMGRNGIFTKHLLESLKRPDAEIERVFKRARQDVVLETRGRQTPWESSSLIGDFSFRRN